MLQNNHLNYIEKIKIEQEKEQMLAQNEVLNQQYQKIIKKSKATYLTSAFCSLTGLLGMTTGLSPHFLFFILPFIGIMFLVLGFMNTNKTESIIFKKLEKFETLNHEEKIQLKSFLNTYSELSQYNRKRLNDNRPWLKLDLENIKNYLKQKESQSIDENLNQIDSNQKPKYLTTSL